MIRDYRMQVVVERAGGAPPVSAAAPRRCAMHLGERRQDERFMREQLGRRRDADRAP